MANQNSAIDNNYKKTLLGVTDDASAEIRRILVDPTTGRLKCSAIVTATFLSLSDTPSSYTGQSGKVVAVKATEDGLEFTAAGTVGGSGTINELAYWSAATTLGTLAVETYPSLAELVYLKGTSSAIQTQLNGKQASMGADDNYVTDAEKIVIGNTSGTNTGDNAVNSNYKTLEEIQDDLGGTVGGDGFIKTANSHLTVTYSDATPSLTLGVVTVIIYDPVGIEFGSTTQNYDISGNTWVSAVAGGTLGGIPDETVDNHKLANCLTSIATSRDSSYLAVEEKTGAASATNPLTVQFLFTGITTFSTIRTRSRYIGSVSHNMSIQLWNYITSAWDTYATFSGEPDYVSRNLEVFSPANYISGGAAKLQFIHTSSGLDTHEIYFDYITLVDNGGGSGAASIASGISYVATGNIAATNVQTAINELDDEKAPSASPTFTGTVTLPKTLEIQDTSADHQYVLAVSELTADRTITLPLLTGTDTFVFQAHTQTLTNKRITKRTGTTTSHATPTINTDNVNFYSLTAQAADITSFTTNLSGTPTENQTLWIAITGTAARAITWGTSFEASTVALPTTTVTTARLDVGFVWNVTTSKWRCIASA